MPEYCSCGAPLPPDARFCHKCGKPQFEYPIPDTTPEVDPPVAAALPAAAAAIEISFRNKVAVRTGFVVALCAFVLILAPLPPPLSLLWFPLCAMLAGFSAAYLYRRRTGQRLGIENGARIGWITGVFEFVLMLTLFCVILISISNENGGLAGFLRQNGGKLPNAEQMIHSLDDPTTLIGGLLFALVLFFFMFTLLPMVGGALCGKVFDKD
ncbi:MAG TPA: zinc ribbon domain-containing protein [Bryobacteraceae bacterium]|nr:zinc ribbon domain-containing protein [Bryobacteraceae bacterium]